MAETPQPNFRRIGSIPHHGKGVCRGCRGAVPKKRKTWCSDACVTEALIRKGDPNMVRREVKNRDAGVCAGCGLDTEQLRRVLLYLDHRSSPYSAGPYLAGHDARASYVDAERWLFVTVLRRRRGGAYSHLWEADHVVPVIEGGGGCGLEGYRTLCLPCHKRASASLAARRAEQRRAREGERLAAKDQQRLASWTGRPHGPECQEPVK